MGRSSLAREERRPPIREFLDTFILGSLSTLFGIIVLITPVTAIAGVPIPGRKEPTMARLVGRPLRAEACGVAAVIGEFLGLAGILLGQRRDGAISILSILGTVICLSHFVVFLGMQL